MPLIAFAVDGPGSAQLNQGRDLYNKVLPVREAMDRADKALAGEGLKVTKACFLGTAAEIARPSVAGPCALALAFGAATALKQKRLSPQMVAGYGFGEAAALACVGAVPYEEALLFLRRRGQWIEEAWAAQPFFVMAVTGLGAEALAARFAPLPVKPELLADDSPDACVLGGGEELLRQLAQALASREVKVSPVIPGWNWPHPSFAGLAPRIAEAFAAMKFEKNGNWELYSAVGAGAGRVAELSKLPEIQGRLVHERLNWKACAASMRAAGMDTLVELGAGEMLGAWARAQDNGIRALSSADARSLGLAFKLAI